ncbi:phospho-sugar mutase [Carnobacteriaceae bacterium zg-84]|uniref:phospho-sugar mutase n=1 Tax=Granulicatella sp. zg-84 TaxID=2678503 RepID=UPI0013BFD000|nr:phospho-sugar mutase [Granulicatella sp. zg-84]NEW66322.1 phospho-sugar mutase [Granulicatella sp. zg-84]QMI85387.1 phospho-sugar mutase [Carnobacteriaceae bacterium zg-84]
MSWETTYEQWKNFDNLDEKVKESLNCYDDKQAEDAFYEPLSFGTAGMRGVLGAGINRMNIYTVRQATKGLALFIESVGEEAKQRGVAIAYDSRHQSKEFAIESARVLGTHGIPAYVFEELRPTPELSFAVRELKTFAGIMITASHNPANYNGYKVYGQDGGQMPPQDADALTTFIRSIDNPLTIDVLSEEALLEQNLLHWQSDALDNRYLEQVDTVTINKELVKEMSQKMTLVFTPLHGAGQMLGEKALKQAGFESVYLVPEQAVADADFSTVRLPNPEDADAFDYAIALGKEKQADVLVATDPDADRLGAAVLLPNGEYQVITGNQIAALMVDYILNAHQQAGTLKENSVIAKSIVSSELPTAIATSYGAEMVNVLTGFKFIADKIKQYEADGSKTFMFGFEESYGYLVKSFVRDKDAIQALVLIAEVAAYYKKQGKTLYDGLQALYEKHGYFLEKTISVTLAGIEGIAKIKALMTQFRQEPLQTFGGIQIVETQDFATSTITLENGDVKPLDMPKSDVLKYLLADGTWVAIRPSGTEPKIKFYIGVKAQDLQTAETTLSTIKQDIDTLVK